MLIRLLAGSLLGFALGCAGGSPEPAATAPATPPATTPPAAAPAPAAATAPDAGATAAGSTPAPTGERPLYYDRALTPADLEGRTLRELSLMRNTIFARAGQPFAKPWLDAHFRAQPWYAPRDEQDLSKVTEIDRANVEAIVKAEQAFTRDELLARRQAIWANGSASSKEMIELRLISAALGEWSGGDEVPKAERNPLEDPTVLDGQLTLAQIEEMSRRDLRLLRNTIYARRGRPFQSAVLQGYFSDKEWYSANKSFSEAMLTEVDKRNIQLVQSMEDRLGGPMREWEHQREEGWFVGA